MIGLVPAVEGPIPAEGYVGFGPGLIEGVAKLTVFSLTNAVDLYSRSAFNP